MVDFQKILNRVNNKAQHIACCEPCHFSWEEENTLEFLPEEIQAWLIEDHKRISDSGFQLEDIQQHIKEEMVFFREYLPPDVLERIEADHLNHCLKNDLPYELDGKIYNKMKTKIVFPCKACKKSISLSLEDWEAGNVIFINDLNEESIEPFEEDDCLEPIPTFIEFKSLCESEMTKFENEKAQKETQKSTRLSELAQKRANGSSIQSESEATRLESNKALAQTQEEKRQEKLVLKEAEDLLNAQKIQEEAEKKRLQEESIPIDRLEKLKSGKIKVEEDLKLREALAFEISIPLSRLNELIFLKETPK